MTKDNSPFFILGCVRSGTTVFRNVLKLHPRLIAPEETHVFRWGEPFATPDFNHLYKSAETLQLHRSMDGIDEQSFEEILSKSLHKGDFLTRYFEAFKANHDALNLRCFDKTPQNVYGLPLLKSYFPKAKIIHIIRNPLSVIASVKRGRSIGPMSVRAGLNYWMESKRIIDVLKPLWAVDLFELQYESFSQNPLPITNEVLSFLGEEELPETTDLSFVHPAVLDYEQHLSVAEIALIKNELAEPMDELGYL